MVVLVGVVLDGVIGGAAITGAVTAGGGGSGSCVWHAANVITVAMVPIASGHLRCLRIGVLCSPTLAPPCKQLCDLRRRSDTDND